MGLYKNRLGYFFQMDKGYNNLINFYPGVNEIDDKFAVKYPSLFEKVVEKPVVVQLEADMDVQKINDTVDPEPKIEPAVEPVIELEPIYNDQFTISEYGINQESEITIDYLESLGKDELILFASTKGIELDKRKGIKKLIETVVEKLGLT